jgi:phenylpyruvate tautomerase PptA (4-oxalocrotonate tautomerase family)
MPIATITMYKGRTPEQKRIIADCVQEALHYAGYPENDRFQRIFEFENEHLIVDPTYPNLKRNRTAAYVLVEILVSKGRPAQMKEDIMDRLTEQLGTMAGLAREDVMVVIHETEPQNSSLYCGVPEHELPPIRPRQPLQQ